MPSDLARFIDHTLLKPEATAADVDRLCEEARAFGFVAVCVNPVWVARAAERVAGSEVRVVSVAAFPFGASATEVKAAEARRALADGAGEIDMVMNVGALRGGDLELVRRDIEAVGETCRAGGAGLKVIIEAALLTDEQKAVAARLVRDAGASFVKTSTGFGPGGATVEDVRLLSSAVGSDIGVKASGGIRSGEEARAMIAAGATRIGTSSGVRMMQEEQRDQGAPRRQT